MMDDATRLLNAIAQGDTHAADELLPLVYDELRRLAAHKLAREAPGQTLEATGLVHEAYLRLVGGGKKRIDLEQACSLVQPPSQDLLELDEALGRLAALNPARAEVVKLRFFAGLTMPEVAQTLGISVPTAERYWAFARTWLYAELKADEPPAEGKAGGG
jgi:DNA-directed RNA polymerase specialized sigma24 family protein